MTAELQAGWSHLWNAYNLLYRPGEVFELRALDVPRRGNVSGYFNEFPAAATEAMQTFT